MYEVQVAYALRARAAGLSHVVNVTIVPSTIYSSAAETERLEHNALLVADAQGAFDDVVDLATVDHLDDPSDSTYCFDGLHWTGPATTIVSDVMLPHVRAILAS